MLTKILSLFFIVEDCATSFMNESQMKVDSAEVVSGLGLGGNVSE